MVPTNCSRQFIHLLAQIPPSGRAIFERVRVPSLQVTNIQILVFIIHDRISVTYFLFQISLLVCFYTVVEVK